MMISEIVLLQAWLDPGVQLMESGPSLSSSSNSAFLFYVGFILGQTLHCGGDMETPSSRLTPGDLRG